MAAEIRLSKRLTAIAEMVNAEGGVSEESSKKYCLCDVGTDHAHIPIRLLLDGTIDHAVAMDVIEGPLEKARENIERYGVSDRVTLRLSDGLDAYEPGECQGLVIAGMGGRIMSRILTREPHKSLDFEELILQPQADPEYVRRALRTLGLYIDRESVVLEDNKYYPVIHAVHSPQESPAWGDRPRADTEALRVLHEEAEDLFGPALLRERDAMLRSYLLWQKGVNDRILYSLRRANDSSSSVMDKKAQILRKDELIRAALDYFDAE